MISIHNKRGSFRGIIAILACVALSLLIHPTTVFAAQPITMSAVGDICFTGGHGQSLGKPSTLLSKVAPTLRASDIAFGNLETSLSNRGSKWAKTYTFRGPISAGPVLGKAGFDVVSLANNHSLDYGRSAFSDTLATVHRGGVVPVGAGKNKAQAWEPKIITRNGQKVAFLAFSEITPGAFAASSQHSGTAYTQSIGSIVKAVKSANKKADYVVVSMHWGVEKKYDANARQKSEAHALVNAGADVVLGHHPHRIQGIEYYRGKLIAYSLGNFVFSAASTGSTDTYILSLTLGNRKVIKASARPVVIVSGQPRITSLRSTSGKRIVKVLTQKSKARKTHVTQTKTSLVFNP